ncbi:MAG TPA: CHAT domain-containing protein, partial [Thermoanaerobaculia bacterium]|nr:CHAT domain-containing protein [Thermoanaerobaculia bacterium]
QTKRYLVQEHVVSVSPSATLLVESLERDQILSRMDEPSALLVGDPAFDTDQYLTFGRLPEARKEVLSIAKIFTPATVLLDRQATPAAFLAAVGDKQIVHLGCHAIVNPSDPLLSQILLANSAQDPGRGVLYSWQLLGRHFKHTRLVVLAACGTADGQVSNTEGIESLARPFLAAGAPAVIASLWDVSDQGTAAFFDRFYHYLREGLAPVVALQATQIAFLRDDRDHYRLWGAFELLGGNSSYPISTSKRVR